MNSISFVFKTLQTTSFIFYHLSDPVLPSVSRDRSNRVLLHPIAYSDEYKNELMDFSDALNALKNCQWIVHKQMLNKRTFP